MAPQSIQLLVSHSPYVRLPLLYAGILLSNAHHYFTHLADSARRFPAPTFPLSFTPLLLHTILRSSRSG